MSSIKTTQIDGDISVGRNVAMGGKAEIAGSVVIGHNLKVGGWLEAVNIKGANKGVFLTVQALREAYPNPHDGWFAGVGSSTPFTAYIGNGGEWVSTGGTIEVNIDLSEIEAAIEGIEEDVEANSQSMEALEEDIDEVAAMVHNINGKLGAANGIATLDANGKVIQLPDNMINTGIVEDVVKSTCLTKGQLIEKSGHETGKYLKPDGSVASTSGSVFVVDTYVVNPATAYCIEYRTYSVGVSVDAWGAVYDELGNVITILGLLPKSSDSYTAADIVKSVKVITASNAATMKFFYVTGSGAGVAVSIAEEYDTDEINDKVKELYNDKGDEISPESVINDSGIGVNGELMAITFGRYEVAEFNVSPNTKYYIDYKTANLYTYEIVWGAVYDSEDNPIDILGLLKRASDNVTAADKAFTKVYVTPNNAAKIRLGYRKSTDITSKLYNAVDYDIKAKLTSLENEVAELETTLFNTKAYKVLLIGNSFMNNATAYLNSLVSSAGIDVSEMCVYKVIRASASFRNWYDVYHDSDNVNMQYTISKVMGGLTLEGFTEGTYSGNSGTQFRNVLKAGPWDIIVIQQRSDYTADFDAWLGNGNDGYLKEYLRILRTLQPQARIGFLMSHASPMQSPDGTLVRAEEIADAAKSYLEKYPSDFVIPYGIAVENLRVSQLNTTPNGFTCDNHHLAAGLGLYVAAASTFQALIAPRYGVSVLGNSYRVSVPQSTKDNYPNYEDNFVDVDNNNAYEAQMCAILAANDMYVVNNPDNIEL